ncbi:hypothetical protein K6L09_30465 [Burkholderia cepacia]
MSAVDAIQDMSDVAEAKNDSIDDCEQRRFRGGGRDNSSAPASEAGCKRTELNPANQGGVSVRSLRSEFHRFEFVWGFCTTRDVSVDFCGSIGIRPGASREARLR